MGSIQYKYAKDGTKLYYAVYKTPDGGWKWEAGGKLKKNADALLKRRESEVAEGKYGTEMLTFKDFGDKWLSDYASLKVKPQTRDDYEAVVRKHLKPFFGDVFLKSITPVMVQEYVANMTRLGLSPRTVNKTITVLKLMFKHAEIWGYLSSSPAKHVEKPRQVKKEMDYLRPEESRRLLRACSPMLFPICATALLTGARQGEILALKWSDVDFENGVIYIRRSFRPEYGFVEPKSARSVRAVYMSPELVKILSTHKARTNGIGDSLVFPNRVGKPILHQNLMRREFEPALKRAGLRRIRFHDLRHSYAALMISLGENIKFIQTQMGHSSITTTLDSYGHLLPEASEGAGRRLDALVFSDEVIPFPDGINSDQANPFEYV